MPAALRPLRVTQIGMSFYVSGHYVFLLLATKVAKVMNEKGFTKIRGPFIPRFQNLARKLL
ncbi:MAG: hypothetical protein CVU31_15375 [Betaproteobacteria bacterium HGW-Betaproteobacteria-4]|jgi:hypothetical protein|nr:MAG: hypothetical protein CVU31_15375 [Betaproteobacteria bacterium HGW-Betaproteobacteria-4]